MARQLRREEIRKELAETDKADAQLSFAPVVRKGRTTSKTGPGRNEVVQAEPMLQ